MKCRWAVLGIVSGSTLACLGPRDPGPLEDEWGQVLFWEVTSIDSATTQCTDEASLQGALTHPPLLPGTFVTYRLAQDGRSAVATECTETRAESCTDMDGFDFVVNGSTLVHTEPPMVVTSSLGCDVSLVSVWTMEDSGETGVFDVSMTFPYDGTAEACEALEASVVNQSNNGQGLVDCEVTLTAELAFTTADG